MRKYANDVLGKVHGADVIPIENLNGRLNKLEDILSDVVRETRDDHLETGEKYIEAQDMYSAFLLLRNERDELKQAQEEKR